MKAANGNVLGINSYVYIRFISLSSILIIHFTIVSSLTEYLIYLRVVQFSRIQPLYLLCKIRLILKAFK